MSDASGYPGFASRPQGEEVNNVQWMIDQAFARLSKMMLVKVIAVYPGNNANTPTTVDVQPMIDMVDPVGNRTPHGIIYGVPAARQHAGGNAFLNDPVVNDVGLMHTSDRDSSSLYANGGAQSPPGSSRRHDLADGHYHGGLYTIAPTNYVDVRGGNIGHVTSGNVTHDAQQNITSTAGQSISHTATQGSITQTSQQQNISQSAPMGTISLSAGQAISLSAPALGLPPGGVSSSALASGAASSNVGPLGGDLSGTLPDPEVVGITNVADANALPIYASNAAARSGGLNAGQLYVNDTVSGSEYVICVAH